MTVGIAGLGKMGTAIAERLLEEGEDLVVWNRSPGKVEPLERAGAGVAASPGELVSRVDVVLTILTDADAIDSVYRGEGGILAADLSGKLVIDMSTVRPETEVALGKDVTGAGADFVECPVAGTTGPARQGKLIGLVGAEAAALERARPVLGKLCRRIEHVGPVGAGASMKLAINLPLLVFYQALGEAWTLCGGLGLDPEGLIDLFADSAGGPNILKVRGPAVAKAVSGGDPGAPTFDVDSIRKDLRTMIAEAESRGRSLPLVERTLQIYDEASRSGLSGKDGSTLAGYWPAHGK